jgi:hypothetical protein
MRFAFWIRFRGFLRRRPRERAPASSPHASVFSPFVAACSPLAAAWSPLAAAWSPLAAAWSPLATACSPNDQLCHARVSCWRPKGYCFCNFPVRCPLFSRPCPNRFGSRCLTHVPFRGAGPRDATAPRPSGRRAMTSWRRWRDRGKSTSRREVCGRRGGIFPPFWETGSRGATVARSQFEAGGTRSLRDRAVESSGRPRDDRVAGPRRAAVGTRAGATA